MKKSIIAEGAPKAIGPYSHGVIAGGFFYSSGQLGIDTSTGTLAKTVEEQTEFALKNVETIAKSCGYSLEDVVKTTVFIKNMGDFAAVNQVYAKYFTKDFPARSCVEVAALPLGALVEIEVVAYKE